MTNKEKERKTAIQKFEYLKNEESFWDEIKSILSDNETEIIVNRI